MTVMTNDHRFVIDTNVVVSASIFPNSTTSKVVSRAKQIGKILLSSAVLYELAEVLGRKKLDKYVSLESRVEFLTQFASEAQFIDILSLITACRDPKDDKFLELAVNGRASCLISGDEDLLTLNPFREIPILTPAAFLTAFPP